MLLGIKFTHQLTGHFPAIHYLYIVIIVCLVLMILAIAFIGVYISIKNRKRKKDIKRKNVADNLIQRVLFSDEEQNNTDKPRYKGYKLVRDANFRRILTAEILSARKNISGASAERLKQMYEELHLEKHALLNTDSRYWHIKAKGLQELAIMEMRDYVDIIIPYADHPNELVRIEAQAAIVKLQGYKGLLFLDTVTYPVSDWQQIKLLHELSNFQENQSFVNIESWLQSANYSVIIFAMRIASNNHLFNIHDNIMACMDHEEPRVRLRAIQTLNEIYTEHTTDGLKKRFAFETHHNQIAILKVLQTIGTERDVTFMFDYLDNDNNELRLTLIRTIATISDQKLQALEKFPRIKEAPWAEMMMQIKGEIEKYELANINF
ncbi:hypothetical protein SAMN05518672_103116 [Chitinophaga sp. CF118]|uniref:HEAT repeat domain-containing protein n=1 Tax=Chitinophaga sp. CF118 TaxID=1884367 RepID=UPI0008E0A4C6|nr:HEAT repeat domain-containing protein [Chitinophaga sp. CF118]SFD76267.1 hypothetical protein SAMN05518672_103116 [Chitinophaga sp. CF118]